jgi:hypothetical protein
LSLAVIGSSEFNGDAGAQFGLLDEGVAVGFVLGLFRFWLGARWSQLTSSDKSGIGVRNESRFAHARGSVQW